MFGWLIKKFITKIPADNGSVIRHSNIVENTKYDYLEADLDVLIWNLHKSRSEESRSDLDIMMQRVDLALFQEYWQGGKLFNHLSNYPVIGTFGHMFDYKNHPTGVLTAARARPLKIQAWPSIGREPIIKTPKMILETHYAMASGSEILLVLNVHGLLCASSNDWEDQMLEAFSLIKSHKGPVIFAGDFNTKNRSRFQWLLKQCVNHDCLLQPIKANKHDQLITRNLKMIAQIPTVKLNSSDHLPIRIKFAL